MYYLYRTECEGGYYLHKSQNKEYAQKNGQIIFQAETAIEFNKEYQKQLNGQGCLNKRKGTSYTFEEHIPKDRRIVCVETGKVYENMVEVAKEIGCTKQYVSYAVIHHTPIKGMFYRRFKEECDA